MASTAHTPEQVKKAYRNYKLCDLRLKRFLAKEFSACSDGWQAWTRRSPPNPTDLEQHSAARAICRESRKIPAKVVSELQTNICGRRLVNQAYEASPDPQRNKPGSNYTHKHYIRSLEIILAEFQKHRSKSASPKRKNKFSVPTKNKFAKLAEINADDEGPDSSNVGERGAKKSNEEDEEAEIPDADMELWACQDIRANQDEVNVLDASEPSNARITRSGARTRSSSGSLQASSSASSTANKMEKYHMPLMQVVHLVKDLRKMLLQLQLAQRVKETKILFLTNARLLEFILGISSHADATPEDMIVAIQEILQSKGLAESAEVVRNCFEYEPPNFGAVNAHSSELARQLKEPDEQTLTAIILLGLVPMLGDVHEVVTRCFTEFMPLKDYHGLEFEYPKEMIPQLTVKAYKTALQKGQHPLEPVNGRYPSREFMLAAASMAWNSESDGIGWTTRVPDHRLEQPSVAHFLHGATEDIEKPDLLIVAGLLHASITSWQILESSAGVGPNTGKPDHQARLRSWATQCQQSMERLIKGDIFAKLPEYSEKFTRTCQIVAKMKENHPYGCALPQASATFAELLCQMLESSTNMYMVEYIAAAVMHLYNAMRQVFPEMPRINLFEIIPQTMLEMLYEKDQGMPTAYFRAAFRRHMDCSTGPPTDKDTDEVQEWYASTTENAKRLFDNRERPYPLARIRFLETTLDAYTLWEYFQDPGIREKLLAMAQLDDYEGAGEPDRIFAYSILRQMIDRDWFREHFEGELPAVVMDYMTLWTVFHNTAVEVVGKFVVGDHYERTDLLVDERNISDAVNAPTSNRVWMVADLLLAEIDEFHAHPRTRGTEVPENIKMLKEVFMAAAPKRVMRVENFRFKDF